jgi:hypothetical protein
MVLAVTHQASRKQVESRALLFRTLPFFADSLPLQVMNHWSANTCSTIAALNKPRDNVLLASPGPKSRSGASIPQTQHSCPCWAHVAHLNVSPRKAYFDFARRHHIYSSSLFRSYSISSIGGCYSTFAFYILTNITSLSFIP